MSKTTVTVCTHVVCDGAGTEKTKPTRDYTEAKDALLKLSEAHPAEFYHLEQRTAEVEP